MAFCAEDVRDRDYNPCVCKDRTVTHPARQRPWASCFCALGEQGTNCPSVQTIFSSWCLHSKQPYKRVGILCGPRQECWLLTIREDLSFQNAVHPCALSFGPIHKISEPLQTLITLLRNGLLLHFNILILSWWIYLNNVDTFTADYNTVPV